MTDNLEEIFSFINENIDKDPLKLRLASNKTTNRDQIDFAITQIECRNKNKTKLSDFLANNRFVFPDSVSAQQSSHQGVATYHASLIKKGDIILDMTSGLGIDAFSMARKASRITAIDCDQNKVDALRHNCKILNISNLQAICTDSIELLRKTDETFDVIFIDPSRRDSANKRLFGLQDCSPDVIGNHELILQHGRRILIKASPMIDVSQTIRDLSNITAIRAVGIKGECKEILIEMKGVVDSVTDDRAPIRLQAVNLDNDGGIISDFHTIINNKNQIDYISETDSWEDCFLLEPSSMIMKISPWSEICQRFNAKKLDGPSHLFLTKDYNPDFPGRVSKFERIIKKQDRKTLAGLPLSVISRNYPVSTDELRKSLKLKEGDANFLYATRVCGKPVMLLTSFCQNR
ncbi:MAG: RsmD family RNA methyltransferase [Muribaculaceae bacterium]|nr:RsmD family RNA methyltransferase [Muribaculaceae bacterium]